jgi:hypothetical protein
MSELVIAREAWWNNHKLLENLMGMYNRSEMVMVQGLPCVPTAQG